MLNLQARETAKSDSRLLIQPCQGILFLVSAALTREVNTEPRMDRNAAVAGPESE